MTYLINQKITISNDGKIYLTLPGQKVKNIGWLNQSRDTYHKFVDARKHAYHYSNSINFNYEFLRDSAFRFIIVHYGNKELITERLYVLAKGKFIHYKNQRLDKQIGINLFNQFGLNEVEKWKKEKISQDVPRIQQPRYVCESNRSFVQSNLF